jgi:hypothetical protein
MSQLPTYLGIKHQGQGNTVLFWQIVRQRRQDKASQQQPEAELLPKPANFHW